MRYALILCLLALPAQADDKNKAAMKLFRAFADTCTEAFDDKGQLTSKPQRWDLQMPTTYGDPEPVSLWQFPCALGAYNALDLFILGSQYGDMQVLTFAAPDLHVVNENPDDGESKVVSVDITGWRSDLNPINPSFDPKTLTLTAHGSWRGLDDAFDDATYVLIDGHFRLVRYEADADYDGEQHAQTLYTAP
jgi:hypothetical protein